jgi:acetyl-CoA carboxylase carboxyltransferase component
MDDHTDGDADAEEREQRRIDAARLLAQVQEAKAAVADEGRPAAVERQHSEGKLTARERIDYLCDEGSFTEIGQLAAPNPTTPDVYDWEREDAPADGIVTGVGEVDGRPAGVIASDFTVKGGSIGHTGGRKIVRVLELADRRRFPVVMLWEGGGHRIQEGLDARAFSRGDSGSFGLLTDLSGAVPLVAAMMGPGFAGPTNYASLCDFVPMVEGATMGIAGPALVKAALGLDLAKEEYGSARFHTVETGMADRVYEDDEACLDGIRAYLSYLPRNAARTPPVEADAEWTAPYREDVEHLAEVVPSNPRKSYDVGQVLDGILDQGSAFELKPRYARNIVTAFGRIEGRPVGVVANDPRHMAGTLDTPACDKAAHFISLCDAFNLPLCFLVDIPGVLPGPDSERAGIARHSGKPLFEIGRATVPIASVVMRRGYGIGYLLMAAGRSGDSDLSVVWPTAEIAAMSIEGAVDIVYREEIESADDPERRRQELIEKFTDRTGAIRAVEHLGVDGVVDPRETRELVATTFDRAGEPTADTRGKKHGIDPI